jgi:deoxyribodipyrimidine photo-lyase
MWFRRDLRLADHPALAAAAATGDVVALFVVDPLFTARAGAPRRAFMARALRSLSAETGGALVHRHGDPVAVVPAIAAEVGADAVYVSADYNPYGRRRDDAVAAALAADGRALHRVGSPYAVDPGTVCKADGSGYAVFTPFRRAWLAAGWAPPERTGDVSWAPSGVVRSDPPPDEPCVDADLPPATAAHFARRWEEFVGDHLDSYAADRNLPGIDGTSRMSPALRWGIVHPRRLLADLGTGKSDDTFRSELAWREFYADVLFRRPESAHAPLQPRMAGLAVDTDARARVRFAAWCAGRTGYPIVDAGIRQLRATGWMHNRVRMIVGSFLVKDLHLPWQWGARFFLQHLVDGDLASNNHGWQWVAGTGTDPAPFFRIFNPTSQSQRFDPDGDYIRTWVGELAGLDTSAIHDPGLFRPDTYPAPIVDHAEERREALGRYNSVVRAAR